MMQHLKRVGWQVGQSLLPAHLISQEESLLSHIHFFNKVQGIPYYGVGDLKWDETLLRQGVISISACSIIFPSGELVVVPENGKINSFDLNQVGLNYVTLYVHLLKEQVEFEGVNDGVEEEEKVVYSVYQLVLSTETHLFSALTSMKFAEFEKDVENRWKLSEKFIPPLFTITTHPFLDNYISSIRSILERFQKELELETSTGRLFQQRTLETKLCLVEVAKMRQFFLNVDRLVISHPYYLYDQICQFLYVLSFIYVEHGNFNIIPYQHERLATLFSKQLEILIQYLKPKSEQLASIPFEKKQNCYVSEKLPRDIFEANEVFFIVQQVDPKAKLMIEGLKLAGYSRLFNIHRFALTGILLLRLESAPFNNNFSKSAFIYKVEKDGEWEYALKEGKLAFSLHENESALQAYLYWR